MKSDLEAINETLNIAKRFVTEGHEVRVGQGVETKNLRIHRYRDSLSVIDLTNAGKRGKTVDRFSAAHNPTIGDDDPRAIGLDNLAYDISSGKIKTYDEALRQAKSLGLEIYEGTVRGVDVAPPGSKPIEVNTDNLYVKIDHTSFMVRDKRDQNNDPTLIPPMKGGRTAVKKFRAWADKNIALLNTMTFAELNKEMSREGIDSHYYCAMD
jgi:hypothetical protein